MANLSFKNLGGVPSKPDYRANIVAAAVAAAGTPVSLPSALATDFRKLGGALDQKQTPACVSHAMAQLMKLWWFLKTGQIVEFSPRYLHIRSGLISNSGPNDGRDPVTVMKVAMKYGCATIATCPNDTTLSNVNYLTMVMNNADAEAAQYKIPGYVPVPVTQYGIREAIQKYGAVSMLFRIGQEFWTNKNGIPTWTQASIDPVRPPTSLADVVSGHELVGNQWNGPLDHFINSWSSAWSQNGESDYLWSDWEPWIIEALAIAEVPPATLALVQGLPAPGEFSHKFTSGLGYGSSGDEVRALQIALAIDGDFTYPQISGFYGDITRQAVLAFQMKYQVAPLAVLQSLNGRSVGPATTQKLNQLFNK